MARHEGRADVLMSHVVTTQSRTSGGFVCSVS